MAWIYLAELGASRKRSRAMCSRSHIVKTTDMLKPVLCLECRLGTFPGRPSGMMCERCRGLISRFYRIASMVAFPARTSRLQDAEQAWRASEADYFSRSFASLARYDHGSSSWKMCQLSVFGEETLSSELWPTSGMTVDGICYPLQMWARTTDESDGFFWPKPKREESAPGLRPGGEDVADSESTKRKRIGTEPCWKPSRPSNESWWAIEPNVGRVVNGLPMRVDRLRGLGNAVVPLQAREAFERLMGFK